MGQKVHPIGFRLGITANHSSQWFARIGKSNNYSNFVAQDALIRQFFSTEINGLHHISIQRQNTALLLHLHVVRPQEVLPQLNELKEKLHKKLLFQNQEHLQMQQVKALGKTSGYHSTRECSQQKIPYGIFCTLSPAKKISATSIAFSIKEELEKRAPFRKAMKKSLLLAKQPGIKGIKIQISGRLNGAEIARTEWERAGSVSLQTLRSNIDYKHCIAHTIYGVLGIKVWVQYED